MKYLVDIDGTICYTEGNDYINAKPIHERIGKINRLFSEGHTIVYFTARGMSKGINNLGFDKRNELYMMTKKQLQDWGCLFHDIEMWKPSADIYIDDKGINSEEFFS